VAINKDVFYAALEELRPVRRTVFRLLIWERMDPPEIVRWFATEGIRLSLSQVMDHIFEAARHCEKRQQEAELQRLLSGAGSH
jgi:hypothetical protein